MLKKQLRLGKKELEGFFNNRSRSFPGDLLRLKVSPRDGKSKWAFVVSSSVKKNAVARNLTRRRMAETATTFQDKITKNYNLVFFFKLESKKAPSFKKIKDDMIKTLSLCGAL